MKKIDMTEYTVTSRKFPTDFSGFKLVMLSDLHSNVYKISLPTLREMIEEAEPDAIVIVGDMINASRRDNIIEVTNFLAGLASLYPIFYELGNHEYKIQQDDEAYGYRFLTFRRFLEEAGVHFLMDDTDFLEKDGVKLAVSGLSIDAPFYYRNPPLMGPGLVAHHVGSCNREYFNLLLAHHPYYFDRYAEWGADLTLSGHLHGGIIRTKKRGLISVTGGLFNPYFDEGAYEMDNGAIMIVGRGLGTHTVKVRINNHPELVLVHLRPALSTSE